MTTIRAAHDGHLPDGEQTDNRASRREADRETRRAAKRPKKAQTGDAPADTREAVRPSLLAQGFDPADVEAMLPPLAAPKNAYTVRQAVADAVTAMRQDLPRSEKGALPTAARRRPARHVPVPGVRGRSLPVPGPRLWARRLLRHARG